MENEYAIQNRDGHRMCTRCLFCEIIVKLYRTGIRKDVGFDFFCKEEVLDGLAEGKKVLKQPLILVHD